MAFRVHFTPLNFAQEDIRNALTKKYMLKYPYSLYKRRNEPNEKETKNYRKMNK